MPLIILLYFLQAQHVLGHYYAHHQLSHMMHGPTNIELTNFIKIRPVGTELFHADGLTEGQTGRQADTDMTKLIVAFRIFANTLKNSTFCLHVCFVSISE